MEVVGMSYTATFDASHKVKGGSGHATTFVRHIARDVDQAAGFYFHQTNPNIDHTRTAMNLTLVNDGQSGWRAPVVTVDEDGKDRPPSAEFLDFLDTRLATVKRKRRPDAVIMRPLVLQLDPRWFDDHCPDWRTHGLNDEAEDLVWTQIEWAQEEFGHENLVGFSIHLDETSPQLQLMMTPITADGRLSQKDFFKGPTDLKRQHQQSRQRLADRGYDVDFSTSARSTERMSSAEFGRAADRVRAKEEELAAKELAIHAMDKRVVEFREKARDYDRDTSLRAAKLDIRETQLDQRTAALDKRTSNLESREADIPRRRAKAVTEGREEGRNEVREARVAYESAMAEANQVPAYLETWMNRQRYKDGTTLLEKWRLYADGALAAIVRRLDQNQVVKEMDFDDNDRRLFARDGGAAFEAEAPSLIAQVALDRQRGG